MTIGTDEPRRDPRRLFTNTQKNHIADRQHQQCHVCHGDLPKVFHVHHVVPWADCGLTEEDNGVAVCPDCHREAEVKTLPAFEPRTWQMEAMPKVLRQLRGGATGVGEFATVSAAPGAGKTLFAGWTFRNLAITDDVERVVVFVPNAHLRGQWADVLKSLNIFLATKGTTEKRSYDGVALTYHALNDPVQVQSIIDDAEDRPTLFILDEVHHLAKGQQGEASAWAVNIARIVGSIDRPRHRVLNLSGTLFRSNRKEQISTISYVSRGGGQVETVADYAVTAATLVAEGQLRHIKLLGFDAEMRVDPVDLAGSAHAGAESIHAVDLDGDAPINKRILAEMIRTPRFIDGILHEMMRRLGHASTALEGAPVKGLVIADGIDHANQIYASLVNAVGPRAAFLAHGQVSSPEAEIEQFRQSREQAIMVAVQKVTEGFDVPDICVLTYLRTWRAPLFVNQMVGRAMRVTPREREMRYILPATVLVPNETEIKAAFADILVGAMNMLSLPPDPCASCGREVCACMPRPRAENKTCSRCQLPWRWCQCTCGLCGKSRSTGCACPRSRRSGQPPLTVEVTGDGEVVHVSIDGNEAVDLHLIELVRGAAERAGVPEVFVEQIAHGVQTTMKTDPMAYYTILKGGDDRHDEE
ncbi:DEAD/DEAH box helicase family protein [Actinopolymorpha sp. B9G3]|uniref:DEAD/DEAH box helicase family protein n=1 Tax=Actinopolymorpha sp. B9G3 TaxID=3158970 RepID=UPI0032D97ADA